MNHLVRQQVASSFRNGQVFLDNASVGPLPTCARQACDDVNRQKEELPFCYSRLLETVEGECRLLLAELIGAQQQEIAFFASVAEGMNAAAQSLPLQPGDNVILCDREFPSNCFPWLQLASMRGVEVRVVPHDGGGLTLRRLAVYGDRHTKVVATSHVQFCDGFTTDLAAIGDWCQARNIYFAVDGAQAVGILPVDVKACHIDFYAACGSKWLLGPFGTGFLYVNQDRLEELRPPFKGCDSVQRLPGSRFLDYDLPLLPTAARFESGARNLPGIAGLRAAVQLVNQAGRAAYYQQAETLTDLLYQRLAAMPEIYLAPCNHDKKTRSRILSFQTKDTVATYRRLRQANIILCLREGSIRVGIQGFNQLSDIDALCDNLGEK